MNIKTFKNELNPMFIEKAKKIYLLARTNGNTLEVNNNIYSFKSDYESKVRLDNKLNIISTECNCKSKYLYCEHTVATLFAIEEFLLKKVVSNTSLNDYEFFVEEFSKNCNIDFIEGNINLIGIDDQSYVNCYGAIKQFIENNVDYVIKRLENDVEVNVNDIKVEVKQNSVVSDSATP